MIRLLTLCALVAIAYCNSFYAQTKQDSLRLQQLDEVVISDTRFEIEKSQSGKIISRIDAEDLKKYKGISVGELLNSISGIDINGSRSNDGQNLNYYIRGGRNRQVLILIDGIQMTDPSQIANDYDLRLLQTGQIEQIEVLKGAASTLYGNSAATAVINIKLKKPANKAFKLNYSSVFGTNQSQEDKKYRINSFVNAFDVSGTIDGLEYKLLVANRSSKGFSALKDTDEDDPYNSVNTELRLGYKFGNKTRVTTYFNTNRFKSEFDDGFAYTDADFFSRSRQNRLGLNFITEYQQGSVTINSAYNNIKREIDSDFPAEFVGENYVIDAFNKYIINDKFYAIVGINSIFSKMDSFSIPFGESQLVPDIESEDANTSIVDPYINILYTTETGFNLNSGLRLNNHSEYGSHLVYSVNPSYNVSLNELNLKLLATYSTAYITPSLYQLYVPGFGNAELKPEENRTIELGTELRLLSGTAFSLIYFNRKEENFIAFKDLGDFVFQYQNEENTFVASGLELEASAKLSEKLYISGNFTYTKVEEELDLRIPEFMVNSSLHYNPSSNFNLRLDYSYNGERNDSFFNANTFASESVVLDSYNIFDLFLSYGFKEEKVTVFANISNLLNEDYTEIYRYNTKGRNVSLGLNLNF